MNAGDGNDFDFVQAGLGRDQINGNSGPDDLSESRQTRVTRRQRGKGASVSPTRGEHMPDIWTYRDDVEGADFVGFEVEATDGEIGKVDSASYDVGSSYIVVDTGPWLLGQQSLLPAATVTGVDHDERRVFVDRSKEEIKNAPEYDPDEWASGESRAGFEGYYAPYLIP